MARETGFLINHQSFVYTQLNDYTVSISSLFNFACHLFILILNLKTVLFDP